MNFGLFFVMQRPADRSEQQIFRDEIPQMVAADALGYHSVWVAEHHFSDYGVCSAPQVLAAAVAGQTKRIRLGMGIVLLPLHDPVQIAEELAVLDHVSGGRLEVGIGRASTPLEYSGYGVPFEQSRERVDEGLEILRGVWTNDSFSHEGRFRQVNQVHLVPKPLQQPHPPLYLACNSAESVPIAARHGLPMMSNWLVLNNELAERREVYRRVSAECGFPSGEVEARLTQTWHTRFIYVHEDEKRALEDPREHILTFMGAAAARPRTDPGSGHRPLAFEDYLRQGTAFYGTPDQVVEKIAEFREQTGIENVLCHVNVRAMDAARVMRSLELFAAKVMPRLA